MLCHYAECRYAECRGPRKKADVFLAMAGFFRLDYYLGARPKPTLVEHLIVGGVIKLFTPVINQFLQ